MIFNKTCSLSIIIDFYINYNLFTEKILNSIIVLIWIFKSVCVIIIVAEKNADIEAWRLI